MVLRYAEFLCNDLKSSTSKREIQQQAFQVHSRAAATRNGSSRLQQGADSEPDDRHETRIAPPALNAASVTVSPAPGPPLGNLSVLQATPSTTGQAAGVAVSSTTVCPACGEPQRDLRAHVKKLLQRDSNIGTETWRNHASLVLARHTSLPDSVHNAWERDNRVRSVYNGATTVSKRKRE